MDRDLTKEAIVRGFEALIRGDRLFGADMRPDILKKSGKGVRFLIGPVPPMRTLLSRWGVLFGNRLSPDELFERLAVSIHEFNHRDNVLLCARDRFIYDTLIVHGEEPIGGLTLEFYAIPDRSAGWLGRLLRRKSLKIVYIERIHLREQSSGYASSLFRDYEKLFHNLGFNQFRLKASLSVGKYYWAKEGFDFVEKEDLDRRREGLKGLVKERNLPVKDAEIARLNHAYDIARFRKDLRISVFRDGEGYYSLSGDETHVEEFQFPLGKAYLLCAGPWDGHKIIYTNTPRRTGFVFSRDYLDHRTRAGHRESPRRLEHLMKAIQKEGLRESLVFLAPYVPERDIVEKIHLSGYLDSFRDAAAGGGRTFQTADCSISPRSYEVALLAAGGVMAGVDAVMNGRVENIFCAVRPPGHHAGRDYAMGFCFINNVSVGAVHARTVYGVERIFILDWDAHHGNGTQDIFEEDPLTYFCSIHEHPTFCFPGTGRRMERGKGKGDGFTRNVTLRPHDSDDALVEAFEGEVVPEIDRFRPDLIMISAGFDGHHGDGIAGLRLTEASYAHMTRRLCELADKHCGGKIVSVLEGGYEGPVFAASVVAHLRALQGRN
ncbi:MAG: histone deacetylase [Candidatus Deferrimicrobiota bacterium]